MESSANAREVLAHVRKVNLRTVSWVICVALVCVPHLLLLVQVNVTVALLNVLVKAKMDSSVLKAASALKHVV